METNGTNLYIVDDDQLRVADLKHFLQTRFGLSLNISTFFDGDSCLKHIDKDTHIVILDYGIENKNGIEILKSIKALNSKVEVIFMAGNENVAVAIIAFREGVHDYVMKGKGAFSKIGSVVTQILMEPLRHLVKEFGISRYLAAFILTFVGLGGVVYIVMQFMK